LAIIGVQFEDPLIAKQPKGQDRRDPPSKLPRHLFVPEVITESYTDILPEDNIMEHTSETGEENNGKDGKDLSPA